MSASPTPGSTADRNLLFGILALQMDFITRDQLVAGMNTWVLEKTKPLGRILIEQRSLREDLHDALAVMVDKHLEVHGNDPQRSLQALSSDASARGDLQQIGDADVQASLAHLPAATNEDNETHTRQPSTIDLSTSSAGPRFRILRPHAKGGLGQVSVAFDRDLNREVALKELLEPFADNPTARGRFILEAEITGGLEHPGIVPVYGLGMYPDGRPFYAMRLIRGASLKQAIEEYYRELESLSEGERILQMRQLLGRFIDVCQAIAYAHSRGVMHRDLKPGNVMLCNYGETLIIDWGLAKVIAPRPAPSAITDEAVLTPDVERQDAVKTQAGASVGTPAFMSPEQALGRHDLIGPATDNYGLGATLYVLLTGQLPFPDKDTGELLQKIQRGDFLPPRRRRSSVPRALEAVCCKAMALRPEDRYRTPLDLANDIEHWLADEPVSAFREPWLTTAARWIRRRRALVTSTAAALFVALIAGGIGTVWYQSEQARQRADAAIREAEATRKRGLAEQAIGDALDRAEKMHAGLHAQLEESGGVFLLLNDPSRWEAQVQSARAAVDGAQAILTNSADVNIDAALAGRAAQLAKDILRDDAERRLALALEKIRMDRSAISNTLTRELSNEPVVQDDKKPAAQDRTANHDEFDNVGAARAYPLAFAEANIAIHDEDTSRTAECIASSPIKEQLVAALDEWANVALRLRQFSLVEQLLAIARRADPDTEWRDRLRRPDVLRDSAALAALAKSAPAAKLSPPMIMLMVNSLPRENPERAKTLRTGLMRFPADFWLNLQLASDEQHANLIEAIGFARTAVAVRPYSAAAYSNLALMLGRHGKLDEAIAAFDKALEIEPRSHAIYNNLGGTLRDHRRAKQALAAVEKSLQLNPNFAKAHDNRGCILGDMNRYEEALAAHRQAYELDPENAETNNNLGVALRQTGHRDEAIAAYERAIKLNPSHATAYSNLGLVLWEKKEFVRSAAVCRKAVAINPKSAFSYNHLGMALDDLGQDTEAIATFRKSIELKDDFAESHYNLGLVYLRLKQTDDAVASFKKSVALYPNLPQRQGALGKALLQQGNFADALAATKKALDLSKPGHDLLTLLRNQSNECQRCLLLEKRLSAVLDASDPAPALELAGLALFCHTYKERYVAALQLYRRAFVSEPSLAENLDKRLRYNAACAAVLAGLGTGPQAAKLSDSEKTELRQQALQWLQLDLAAHTKATQSGSCEHIVRTQDQLAHWQTDNDLAGVRAAGALGKLPKDEQKTWNALWNQVPQRLKAAQERFHETRVEGELTKGALSKVHAVALKTGGQYVFDLESTAFDAFLKLEDPAGKLIAEDDDIIANVNRNARLFFRAAAEGQFRLIATSYLQREVGPYTLRIRELITKK